jgi:hypothetical protein
MYYVPGYKKCDDRMAGVRTRYCTTVVPLLCTRKIVPGTVLLQWADIGTAVQPCLVVSCQGSSLCFDVYFLCFGFYHIFVKQKSIIKQTFYYLSFIFSHHNLFLIISIMISRISASIVMSFALAGNSNAFSPNSIKPLAKVSTKLHSHAIDSDSDAMYMMMKAEACAHSDTCSIEDAERYLQEILHLQSDCVAGKLASHQICQDVQYPAEIISTLRSKIAQKQQR